MTSTALKFESVRAGRRRLRRLYGRFPPMDETRLKRLRYRAWRRGFREADLILGPFADTHASTLTEGQLAAFEILLEQPDPDLYAWIVGARPAPAAFDGEVLALIRSFHLEARLARGDDLGA